MRFIALIFAFLLVASFAQALKKVHKGQDRWSDPLLWRSCTKGAGYGSAESVWGGRCLDDLQCSAARRCSKWGWCQDTAYKGPFIPVGEAYK